MSFQCQICHTSAGPVEYNSFGQGKPVMLIHGGHSNCQDTLASKGLDTNQYQFIIPSRPGYGRTPLLGESRPESTAKLLIALLDSLNIDQCIVYGISAGGPTAIAMSALFPERTEKLILASAVTQDWLQPGDPEYHTAKIIFRPRVERLTWMMVHAFARRMPKKLALNFFKEFSSYRPVDVSDDEARELCDLLQKYQSGTGFINDLEQTVKPEWLEGIHCETLVLHSRFDESVPLAHAQHARNKISKARLEVLDNKWGHMLWLGDEGKRTAQLVHSFLNENVREKL